MCSEHMWKNLTHREEAGPRDRRGCTQSKAGDLMQQVASAARTVLRLEVVMPIQEQCQSLE